MNDTETATPAKKKGFKKGLLLGLLMLLLLAAASGGWYMYYRESQTLTDLKKNPSKLQDLTKGEVATLVAKVGAFMQLPRDEQPTVATVADAAALKKVEPFFANSVNGDKVLIFAKAKKAILFRPSTNKIIDVAPINIGPSENAQGGTPSAQSQVAGASTAPVETSKVQGTVELRNGTTIPGLTVAYETTLKSKTPGLTIVGRGDAATQDFLKSVIIDVKGDKKDKLSDLAKVLGLNLGVMPTGEATPAGDFLIILGADAK